MGKGGSNSNTYKYMCKAAGRWECAINYKSAALYIISILII